MHDPTENQGEAPHTHGHGDTQAHEHAHPQGGEHEHRHEHDHDHEHTHEHHHHGHDEARPLDRLHALMRYMTRHNADHARELEALARQLKDAGNEEAYNLTMEAVRFFDQGNAVLSRALEKLSR